jgi:hypothetical protein
MDSKTSTSTGIGFFGLLTLVFIVLKLINVINWSWWLVLAPAWGSAAFVIFCLIVVIILHIWANHK